MISSTNFGFCSMLVSTILPLPPVMVPSGVTVAVLSVELPALFVSLFAVASASAVTTYVLPLIVMVPSACGKVSAFIVHLTFHNAVLVVRVGFANLALIQTAKGMLPAIIIIGGNGNIGFRAVVYRCPVIIFCAGCQAALELDVDLFRLLRSAKIVLTICIFPELIELNVDQCAPGVGKDCGNSGQVVWLLSITPSTMVLSITSAESQPFGTVTLCSLEPSSGVTSSMV